MIPYATPLALLATLALLGPLAPATAGVFDDDHHLQDREYQFDYDESLRKPWVELQTKIPPYPRDENLIALRLKPTSRQQLLVDGASLTVGKDRVVRLIYVLRAPGGGETVLFEGFRCDTRSYKSYAYGLPGGKLKPFPEVEWRAAPWTDYGYRRHLLQHYLCADGYNPYPRKEILRRARDFEYEGP